MGYRRYPAAQPRRRQIIIGLIVVAVLLGLAALRYYSPLFAARNFLGDVYNHNYDSALQQVCPDQRDTFNNAFTVNKIFGAIIPTSVDTTKLSYDIGSESLSSAIINAHGTYHSIIGDFALNGQMSLQASGLGWCVTSTSGT